MDNDTIKTILMAISATIALTSLIYTARKSKSDKSKHSVKGDVNITDSTISLQGNNNTIDQSKNIINSPVTRSIDHDQLDFQTKKAEANHKVTLILLPAVLCTMFTLFLTSYLSFDSGWIMFVALIGYLIIFNALKLKLDKILDNAANYIAKLTFLNPITLVFFSIDLDNKQYHGRLKNLVIGLSLMLICGLLLVAMVTMMILNPPTFSVSGK